MRIDLVPATARARVLYVVATTIGGTDAALRLAVKTATLSGSPIILLIPQLASPGAGDRAAGAGRWSVIQFTQVARRVAGPRVAIRVCPCRNVTEAVQQNAPSDAVGIVGPAVAVLCESGGTRGGAAAPGRL